MSKAVIKSLSVFVPENVVDNHEIENRVNFKGNPLKNGTLERLLGSKLRRFAPPSTQVSDLACAAAQQILKECDRSKFDLLIFAAASSDLIEPATANIIQAKLEMTCPVMDVKNACNSFVSAMQAASAFIESGMYNNILIVNGEKLSDVINYHPEDESHLLRCMAGYSLGDAGAAMHIGSGEGSRIIYQSFHSLGKHWNLCTVEGGGSMAFRKPEKYFFEVNSKELRNLFYHWAPEFVFRALTEGGWKLDDINCVVSHQITSATSAQVAKTLGIPESKVINTFGLYGNTAAATIPLALSEAITGRRLKKGDKLLVLGLSAGVSFSVQLVEW